jgi:hypothetical protein
MILFLDPSVRMTGAVALHEGVWTCMAIPTEHEAAKRGIFEGEDDARRVLEIRTALRAFTFSAVHQISAVYAERPTGAMGAGSHKCLCGGQHSPGLYRSAKAEGLTIAWVTLVAAEHCLEPARWVAPKDVKKAVLGKASGSKDEVVMEIEPVARRLGIELPAARLKREAVCDAIGVGIAAGVIRCPSRTTGS